MSYSLADLSDVSQVIIAAVSLFLGGYVFIYQKNKDSLSEMSTARLNEQNINLQWFKELIIQPNFSTLNEFYTNLESIKQKITSDNLSQEEIIALNRFIKDEATKFRKYFYDSVLNIDINLYKKIKKNVEDLVSELTITLSDDEHKLSNEKTFEREILDPIRTSKNEIISLIYSYKGI